MPNAAIGYEKLDRYVCDARRCGKRKCDNSSGDRNRERGNGTVEFLMKRHAVIRRDAVWIKRRADQRR